MIFNHITDKKVFTKTVLNKADEEVVVATESSKVEFEDGTIVDFEKRTFSNTDNIFYIFTSDNYSLVVQNRSFGFNAYVNNLSKDKYFADIDVLFDLEDDKNRKVAMRTTSYSTEFTIEETEQFARNFAQTAQDMRWITKVVDNMEELV